MKKIIRKKSMAIDNLRVKMLLNDKIIIFHKGVYKFIPHIDIIRFESDNSYTKVILLNNESFLLSKSIYKFERELVSSFFLRVHQSHIVNVNQIKAYYRHQPAYIIMNNDDIIPVSKSLNKIFAEFLFKER